MNIRAFQLYGKTKKESILCRFLINYAYLCSMNMKKIIYLFAILLMLAGCNGTKVSEKLNQVDSLIAKEQFDSACVIHNCLNEADMSSEDKAHYYLLATQLGYVTNHPLQSDSLLEMAFTYYNKVGNNHKLANAYYYKSLWAEANNNYPQAILYGKEAERLAMNIDDSRLQFKIAENLAYLNGLCENDLLQLQYAKKALVIAQRIHNNNWIAYSYNRISFAFANLNQHDSAFYYIEKTVPYIKYVEDFDKMAFLTNIGLLYKDKDPVKAKDYFEKALTYEELPDILEHLADVYYSTGNKEKAYELWRKALAKNSRYDKINLIHSIISYDLECGNIDNVSKNVDEIINIKDSILNKLKNDTIKDLQLRFDHEVAMHEADKKLLSTQRLLLGSAFILVLMAFYIFYRKKKEEARQREHQDQLYAYTTEIEQLTANKDKALAHISELESNKEANLQKINQLEEEARNAETAIKKLNLSIQKLLNDAAPKLKEGKMLYDQIMEGKTALNWSYREEEYFNKYYAAIHYQSYNRIRKVKRVTKLSAHNMFYLILKEMGKSDEEVKRIMVLSPEGLRSIRSRTKPLSGE
jgi:tetratricopeptide (TPR) repeat protein